MTENVKTDSTTTTQTSDIPKNDTPVTHTLPTAKPKTKSRSKPRRPRRRGASNSNTSDEEGAESVGSLTSASENEEEDEDEDEDEEDADAVEAAVDLPPSPLRKPETVFADQNSTAPASWADEEGPVEEVSFEAFNRGESGVLKSTGKVESGKVDGGVIKKEFTAEQTKKFEERKAKMKERQKVRKAEIKEAKRKAAEQGTSKIEVGVETKIESKEEAAKDDNKPVTDSNDPAAPAKLSKAAKARAKKLNASAKQSTPSTSVDAVIASTSGLTPEDSTPNAATSPIPQSSSAGPSTNPKPANSTSKAKPSQTSRNPIQPNNNPQNQSSTYQPIPGPAKPRQISRQTSRPILPHQQSQPQLQHPNPNQQSIQQTNGNPTQPSHRNQPQQSQSHPTQAETREAYAQRIAEDVKFTPRLGKFWTHDQRHYESGNVGDGGYAGLRGISDYWRGGRGGFRGNGNGNGRGIGMGIRGRGRGGFGRGGFVGGFGSGMDQEERGVEVLGEEKGGKRLEMDKLEAELEARERQREKDKERERELAAERKQQEEWEDQAKKEHEERVGVKVEEDSAPPIEEAVEVKQEMSEQEVAPLPSTAAAPSQMRKTGPERKWGHEGFESIQAVEQFQVGRQSRGRGRGRGGFFPHGGFVNGQNQFNRPRFPPHVVNVPISASSAPKATSAAEDLSTQPQAEDLLSKQSDGVKVNIPGSAALPDTPISTSAAIPSASYVPSIRAETASAAAEAQEAAFISAVAQIEETVKDEPESIPASVDQTGPPAYLTTPNDTGSVNFAVPAHAVPTGRPQPISQPGLMQNGVHHSATRLPSDFHPSLPTQQRAFQSQIHNQQPREFYPNQRQYPSHPQQIQPQPFYPQQNPYHHQQQQQQTIAYSPSPDPYAQHIHSQRNSFSATYFDGRGTPSPLPYNPYVGTAAYQPNGGFFVPARPSKVSIRAPGDVGEKSNEGGNEYASIATPPPQQGQQEGYYQGGGGGYNPYAGMGGGGGGHGHWGGVAGYEGGQVGYGYEEYTGY